MGRDPKLEIGKRINSGEAKPDVSHFGLDSLYHKSNNIVLPWKLNGHTFRACALVAIYYVFDTWSMKNTWVLKLLNVVQDEEFHTCLIWIIFPCTQAGSSEG